MLHFQHVLAIDSVAEIAEGHANSTRWSYSKKLVSNAT